MNGIKFHILGLLVYGSFLAAAQPSSCPERRKSDDLRAYGLKEPYSSPAVFDLDAPTNVREAINDIAICLMMRSYPWPKSKSMVKEFSSTIERLGLKRQKKDELIAALELFDQAAFWRTVSPAVVDIA